MQINRLYLLVRDFRAFLISTHVAPPGYEGTHWIITRIFKDAARLFAKYVVAKHKNILPFHPARSILPRGLHHTSLSWLQRLMLLFKSEVPHTIKIQFTDEQWTELSPY